MTPALTAQGGRTVQVVPLLRLHHLGDRRFDYLLPADLAVDVGVGAVVRVPFGRRTVRAVVVGEGEAGEPVTSELRAVLDVESQAVPTDLMALAAALSHRYLASHESCLRLVCPPDKGRRVGGAEVTPRKTWVRAASSPDGEDAAAVVGRLTPKQRALLEAIPTEGVPAAAACDAAGVGRSVLIRLVAAGLAVLEEPPAESALAPAASPAPRALVVSAQADPPVLTPEQREVVDRLLEVYDTPGFSRRLLWGVTGSGKTEVYLRLLARAAERGEGAILLVPEIALTPQMIGRVRARFGGRVATLHSALSKGERAREYARIASGKAALVVGARSAVFAPVDRLRLIIVDESHEGSYKQEEQPRYHAVTVARLRLEKEGGLLLEGTATPSVESMRVSEEILRLSRRAVGREPECEVVDMRRQGPGLLLAPYSRDALAETLRRGEQAVVLLNRRGFAAYVHCDPCGHALMCTDCELSLTYHSKSRRLECHHCGRTYEQPARCPSCGEGPLTRGSPGTERLARELKALVPGGQVFQMDSDVLAGGRRAQAVLEAFAATRPAVLLGTQMVAKGHDFPDVTLVLVADADTGLYMPDFRASERTFQLLRQVAGRAGRAERPGRVVVQTWNPDVPCIKMALERDERGFYEDELRTRARLSYPPFAEMLRLVTIATDPKRAQVGAQYLAERLAPHFAPGSVWGPARLPVLRGRTRWHVLVGDRDGERMRTIVGQALSQLTEPYRRRGIVLLVDVDPLSFG